MLFRAHRLFDGRTPKVFRDWVVEVEDGRILDVGPRSRAASGSDAGDVVDLGDVTLLPGLIDVHQHLVFDASDDPVAHLQAEDDAAVLQWMQSAAQKALAVGITTIRDLGDRNYLSLTLRDLFRDGHQVGPRILAAGPPLTVSGGHCWFLGGVADGEDGIRRAVRERVTHGVDVIKIMATGGNMTPTFGPHESQYNRAELAAAVDEAHAHGLKIAAHAHGPQGIADALATESGFDRALHLLHRRGSRRGPRHPGTARSKRRGHLDDRCAPSWQRSALPSYAEATRRHHRQLCHPRTRRSTSGVQQRRRRRPQQAS